VDAGWIVILGPFGISAPEIDDSRAPGKSPRSIPQGEVVRMKFGSTGFARTRVPPR
jgi:hypothetical protein